MTRRVTGRPRSARWPPPSGKASCSTDPIVRWSSRRSARGEWSRDQRRLAGRAARGLGVSATGVAARAGGPPRAPWRALSGADLTGFASRLADAPELWRHLVVHSAAARSYAPIWSDDDVTAWVICWSSGHDTGFHDHGESAGAIHVVEGSISEQRLGTGRQAPTRTFVAGAALHVPAHAIHRVFHGGGAPAVSIHAYSPPLTQMGDYRLGSDGALERRTRGARCRPGRPRTPSRKARFGQVEMTVIVSHPLEMSGPSAVLRAK